VRVEVGDDDDDVLVLGCTGVGVGRHDPALAEHDDVLVVGVVEGDVAQPVQGRVLAPDLVEPPQVPREGLALACAAGLEVLPLPVPVLVLLVVDLLLGAGAGHVLHELVARVDAVGRHERPGERRAQLPCRRSAELHVGREDVVRRGPERRPHVVRGLGRELGDVLLQVGLGVAPGVVGVALLEAHLGQGAHHRRLRERLTEPDDLGVVAGHVLDEPLPELHRLGVRVVDAKERDAVVDPDLDHPTHLGVGAGRVVVEVQRIDVLVLLRGVLGEGDRAVGARGEPLRVLLDPRVVGRALQRDVQRHLEPEPARLGDEEVEVLEGPEVWVDRVMAPVGRADGVGAPGVLGARVKGVVGPLLGGLTDGVDRRQVDDVEAHAGDGGQPLGGGAQGSRAPSVGLVVMDRALAAGEELVPRARERELALDEQRVCRAGRDVVPHRGARQLLVHGSVGDEGQSDLGRAGLVAQGCGSGLEGGATPGGAPVLLRGPLEQQCALGEHEVRVDVGLDLDGCVVLPGAERVGPPLDPEGPHAGTVGGHDGFPRVETGVGARHLGDVLDAGGIGEDDRGADGVVALANDGRLDEEGLVDHGFRRACAAIDDGGDVEDGDAADRGLRRDAQRSGGHSPTLSVRGPVRRVLTARQGREGRKRFRIRAT